MTATGPFFDGRAETAIDAYRTWAADEVGQQAMADWHEFLDSSLQHPTGYYESTITLENDEYGSVVHDQGAIYNYWLEGIGRRNAPVTRFEGYHSAERARTEAKAQIERLVDPIPEQFMAAMRGAP